MWRMMPRLAIATLTATLALALFSVSTTDASAVQSYTYSTSGDISGMSSGPITFTPEAYPSMLSTPGSVVLGSFVTNPLPSTATLTYNNTPFTIDLNVAGISGPGMMVPYAYGTNPNTYQYQISGVLNGSIGGDGSSNMFATITSITGSGSGQVSTPPFPFSALVIAPQGIAAPQGSNEGVTVLSGQISVSGLPLPSPAPEPTSIALFGAAIGLWAIRYRSRSKAKA